ncbi:MAG: RpiB/LacA/LacB family sugar-phosphate isomerase [Candidatus Delongbacteria bacterium]
MAAGVIGLAADHAAWDLKRALAARLHALGWTVRDFGTHGPAACDYPDVVVPCAQALARGELDLAVVACGSGIGASISANKVQGVRAALCLEPEQARLSRRHNDARCLVLAARLRDEEQNLALLEAWLAEDFEGGRHERRIRLLHELTQC